MATTKPYAFNTGSTIDGTTQVGDIAIGVDELDYSTNPGGVTWFMGPDEELGYVITSTDSSASRESRFGFHRSSGFTDDALLAVINEICNINGQPHFTGVTDAVNWMILNEYPISSPHDNSPTPSITSTVTPTPTTSPTFDTLGLHGSVTWLDSTHISVTYDWTNEEQLLDWTGLGGSTVSIVSGRAQVSDNTLTDINAMMWIQPIAVSGITAQQVSNVGDHLNFYTNLSSSWAGSPYNANPSASIILAGTSARANIDGSFAAIESCLAPGGTPYNYTLRVDTTYISMTSSADNITHTYNAAISPSISGRVALGAYEYRNDWGTVTIMGEINVPTPSPSPTRVSQSVTPSITPSISVSPTITPSISLTMTPCYTPDVTPSISYTPSPTPIPVPMIEITTYGSTFSPRIETTGNPSVLWTWADYTTDTSLTPTKNYGTAATRVCTLLVNPWTGLTGMNFGYAASDGAYGGFTQISQQSVSGFNNLYLAKDSLTYFLAEGAHMASIDFRGFEKIEFIELYAAHLNKTILLDNHPVLERICVEDNDLDQLNMSGCTALYDLRGALNSYLHPIWPATPIPIYHICIRDNPQFDENLPDIATHFPSLRELLIWNTNQNATFISSGCTGLTQCYLEDNHYTDAYMGTGITATYINFNGNALSEAAVDRVLYDVDMAGRSGGTLDLAGGTNAYPTVAGESRVTSLQGKGWSVNYNHSASPTPSRSVTPSITTTPSITSSISISPTNTPSISLTITPCYTPDITPSISMSSSVTPTPTTSPTHSDLGLHGLVSWTGDTYISVTYDWSTDDQLSDFTTTAGTQFGRYDSSRVAITGGTADIFAIKWAKSIKLDRMVANNVISFSATRPHINFYCDLSESWVGEPYNPNPGCAAVWTGDGSFINLNGVTTTDGAPSGTPVYGISNNYIYTVTDSRIESYEENDGRTVYRNVNTTGTRTTNGIVAFGAYQSNTIWGTITFYGTINNPNVTPTPSRTQTPTSTPTRTQTPTIVTQSITPSITPTISFTPSTSHAPLPNTGTTIYFSTGSATASASVTGANPNANTIEWHLSSQATAYGSSASYSYGSAASRDHYCFIPSGVTITRFNDGNTGMTSIGPTFGPATKDTMTWIYAYLSSSLTYVDISGLEQLTQLHLAGTALTGSSIDKVWNDLYASTTINNGIFYCPGGETSASLTARNALAARGWSHQH